MRDQGTPPSAESGAAAGRDVKLQTALVAAFYLLVVLWTFRVVLPSLDATLPQLAINAPGAIGQLGRWDQSMVLSVVTYHAHALLINPLRLLGPAQCFPMAQAHTLGEHMIGTSLLAVIPYLLTHDPIVTYNVVLMLSVWIPGMTMYLLSREFVRSSASALVAGLLFALATVRVTDFGHPFVHGDLWTPLALLFLYRTVTRRSWASALGLAISSALILLESFYVVIGSGILIGCCALALAWREPRSWFRALPQLLASGAVVLGVAWLVFAAYLQTRATWNLLAGRAGTPVPVGSEPLVQVGVVLAVIGLADRLRGARQVRGSDPRLSLVVGGLVLYWCAIGTLVVPGLGLRLSSPLVLLRNIVPGLDAIRAPGAIASTTNVVVSFLAGYAVLAVTEHRGTVARVALVAALVVCVLLERSYPPLAQAVFGKDFALTAWPARPAEADIRLLRATGGPILRLPFPIPESAKSLELATDLKLVSFDPRPTSACYNSFPSPLLGQLSQLANKLPDPAAAEALYALGFRTVLLVLDDFWPPDLARFEQGLPALRRSRIQLVAVGRTERLAAYRLASHTPVRSDANALVKAPSEPPSPGQTVAPGPATLSVPLVNHAFYTFRLPDPIGPSDLLIRWSDDAGNVTEEHARALLPLALASGARYDLPLEVGAPAREGHYQGEIALAADPRKPLATLDVMVSTSASAPALGAAVSR
jgi:hypothetical protein